MRIAITSGKGGTGKTTVAVNLALALTNVGESQVSLVDCDSEEPNCHLFFDPSIDKELPVTVGVPLVNKETCTLCGTCAEVCSFNAILVTKSRVMVFQELCHGCGACSTLCPKKAVSEVERPIGVVKAGTASAPPFPSLRFIEGILNPGEVLTPRVIKTAKDIQEQYGSGTAVIDSAPGTSCNMVEAVKDSDVCLLVTEPTPFGLHDLKLAASVIRKMDIPAGVVINRAGDDDSKTEEFCRSVGLPVLAKIPLERRIAELCATGSPLVTADKKYLDLFSRLAERTLGLLRSPNNGQGKAATSQTEVVTSQDSHGPDRNVPKPSQSVREAPDKKTPEIVVISGKGGTGKTSIAGALAHLAEGAVVADCDVDASNLHLLLGGRITESHEFSGSSIPEVDLSLCRECDVCTNVCRNDGIDSGRVNRVNCEGCGLCARVCPHNAIKMVPRVSGRWLVSDTAYGPLIRAELEPGEPNSGRLVSLVRQEAKRVAAEDGRRLMITDGPPGIGCPLISAISGADLALVVTEPTVAAAHDLRRVTQVCKQFGVDVMVCINKHDINGKYASTILNEADSSGYEVVGWIPYDIEVSESIRSGIPVTTSQGPAAQAIRKLWKRLEKRLLTLQQTEV